MIKITLNALSEVSTGTSFLSKDCTVFNATFLDTESAEIRQANVAIWRETLERKLGIPTEAIHLLEAFGSGTTLALVNRSYTLKNGTVQNTEAQAQDLIFAQGKSLLILGPQDFSKIASSETFTDAQSNYSASLGAKALIEQKQQDEAARRAQRAKRLREKALLLIDNADDHNKTPENDVLLIDDTDDNKQTPLASKTPQEAPF